MNIKIRNPQLVLEELNTLDKEMEGSPFILVLPLLRQFWKWICLESDITVSETFVADKQVQVLVDKGYPFGDALEFMLVKLLEKDAGKNPNIQKLIDLLRKPVGTA